MPWTTNTSRPLPPGWRSTQQRILTRDPLCRACHRARSTEVDHLIPRSRGGTDHPTNLQGLCPTCHARKTKSESSAARWTDQHRARRPTERRPGIP